MIFLGIPHYENVCHGLVTSTMLASNRRHFGVVMQGTSLLANGFNKLWADALNRREEKSITDFAMNHADIEAENGWLDKLLDEKDRVGADILSVVIPIKDRRGLTSTGYVSPESQQIKRLSLTEVHALPKTFSSGDLPGKIVVNTGLWVCSFSDSWVEQIHFEIRDAIVKNEDGKFEARVLPEDWNFSLQAQSMGLKVFATTSVKAIHVGKYNYGNDSAWGEWPSDMGDDFYVKLF